MKTKGKKLTSANNALQPKDIWSNEALKKGGKLRIAIMEHDPQCNLCHGTGHYHFHSGTMVGVMSCPCGKVVGSRPLPDD